MKALNTFLLLVMCIFLIACGPSQAEHDAQATQIAANIFETQTAEALAITATPIQPTATLVPPTATVVQPTQTQEPPVIIKLSPGKYPEPLLLEVLKGEYQLASGTTLWIGSKIYVNESMMTFPPGLAIEINGGEILLKGTTYAEGTILLVDTQGTLIQIGLELGQLITRTATSSPTPSGPFVYIVVEGDTLDSIATQFGVDLLVLMALNNLSNDTILAGDEIIIPKELDTIMPIPSNTLTSTTIRRDHIADLIAEDAISVAPKGYGIDELSLDLKNLLEELLEVEIPAGTYFVAQAAGVQNMVVRHSRMVVLDPGELVKLILDVACANMERDIPSQEHTFTVKPSGSDDLTRLLTVLEKAHVPYDVEQAAIWIVTDNADYYDLGTLISGLSSARVINEDDAAQAMRLVDEAGIDITARRIWSDRHLIAAAATSELADWIMQREQQ